MHICEGSCSAGRFFNDAQHASSLTHARTHSLSFAHACPLSLSFFLSHTHTLSHVHTHTLLHTFSLSLTHSQCTHTQSLLHTHTLSFFLSQTHTLSHTETLSLTITHVFHSCSALSSPHFSPSTHIHTHTHNRPSLGPDGLAQCPVVEVEAPLAAVSERAEEGPQRPVHRRPLERRQLPHLRGPRRYVEPTERAWVERSRTR